MPNIFGGINSLLHELETEAEQQANQLKIQKTTQGRSTGDTRDAFRHAYGAARMVQKYRQVAEGANSESVTGFGAQKFGGGAEGSLIVKLGGFAKEIRDLNTQAESGMYLHNNSVGADIGATISTDASPDKLAEAVKAALDDGRLISNSDDKRVNDFPIFSFFNKALDRAGVPKK